MGACKSKQLLPLDRQLHESTGSLGKTPLMKASMWRGMALVLIELGADVNAYRRVVLPCEAQNNPTRPLKLELAIYHEMQDPKPHAVIQLWKSQIEERKLNNIIPSIFIFDKDTESRYEILSAYEFNKQKLHRFYDTFRETAEVVNRVPVQPTEPQIPSSNSSLAHRYAELARDINGGGPNASSANTDGWRSLQRDSLNRYRRLDLPAPSIMIGQAQVDAARSSGYNGRGVPGASISQKNPDASSAEPVKSEANVNSSGNPWSRCVICLDATVEGACVPCGHMAFCMPCLKDIKSKNGACPICRATINQIIRLYHV